jgi:hypothetical protein
MRFLKKLVAALVLAPMGWNAWSLTLDDLARLQAGSRIEVPTVDTPAPGMETIVVDTISVITTADGERWYRIDAKHPDQRPAVLVLQVDEGRVEVESMTASMKPRDLGAGPKLIRKISQQGKGELRYRDKGYAYQDDESDDGTFAKPDGVTVPISYYRFTQTEDQDLSLLVFAWPEEKLEVLHLESVDGHKVLLK